MGALGDIANFVKKARLLSKILANYEKEMQAIKSHDLNMLKKVLQERSVLIERLNQIPLSPPSLPFLKVQQMNLNQSVEKIQRARAEIALLYPNEL